jgi:hypothetical protein
MVQAVAEIPEAEAEGKLKSVYEDIKGTLRVPAVSPVFLALATCPNYLIAAWTVLKPNAQTVFFEHQADVVRRTAVGGVAGLGRPPAADERLAPLVRALHYAEPKAFLATVALRSATNGSQPRMQYLPADEKRQIAPGTADGMASLTYREVDELDERVRNVASDVTQSTGTRRVGAELRALASEPDALTSLWSAIRPATTESQYRRLQRSLRLIAENAAAELPFRMDINPHALRHSGLSESDIDTVRELLAEFTTLGGTSVINTALLAVGALGQQAAMESPFPPTVL